MNNVHPELLELIGMDLAGFRVCWMYEVYEINEDGRWRSCLGHFEDPEIAQAFLESRRPGFMGLNMRQVLAAKNEHIALILNGAKAMLHDEQSLRKKLRNT